MKYLYIWLVTVWAICAFAGCSEVPGANEIKTPKEELKEKPPVDGVILCDFNYLKDVFRKEALKRGVDAELKIDFKIVSRDWFKASQGCKGARTVACAEPGKVWVLDTYWNKANCYSREQTLFHEAGHAQAGLRHSPSPPTNMMQPFTISSFVYEDRRKLLLDGFLPRFKLRNFLLEDTFHCERSE